jgi:sulfatase modifying factor 1
MRLPTEAQWEYAARARTTGTRYGNIDQIGWYNGNGGNKTHEVRLKQANAWNLYDMLGNVWQYTSDRYADQLFIAGVDPTGPASGEKRTQRGGSWNSYPWELRVSNRKGGRPDIPDLNVGVRCVGN